MHTHSHTHTPKHAPHASKRPHVRSTLLCLAPRVTFELALYLARALTSRYLARALTCAHLLYHTSTVASHLVLWRLRLRLCRCRDLDSHRGQVSVTYSVWCMDTPHRGEANTLYVCICTDLHDARAHVCGCRGGGCLRSPQRMRERRNTFARPLYVFP